MIFEQNLQSVASIIFSILLVFHEVGIIVVIIDTGVIVDFVAIVDIISHAKVSYFLSVILHRRFLFHEILTSCFIIHVF